MNIFRNHASRIVAGTSLIIGIAWGVWGGVALAQNLSAISPSLPTNPNHFNVQTWTTADGLPGNHIVQILQTEDGYVWLSTGGGLVRFNGFDFRVFTADDFPGWTTSFAHQLYKGRDGTLWFTSVVQGLAHYRDGQFTSFTREDGSPIGDVLTWLELETGALWIATHTGLVRLMDGQARTFTTADGLPSNLVTGLGLNPRGDLTVATDVSLARLENDRFVAVGPPYKLVEGDVLAYLPETDTWWLHFGDSGLLWLRSGGESLPVPETLQDLQITQLQRDATGMLWITSKQGLVTWKDGALEPFMPLRDATDESFGIIAHQPKRVYFRIKRYLFGQYAEGTFFTEDIRRYLDFEKITAIAEGKEGNVWVGTNTGLLNLTPRKVKALAQQHGLSHNYIFPILQTRDGSIWIGTWGAGLNRLQDGRVTVLNTGDGLASDFVRALHENHAGDLWIGTSEGVSRLRGSTIESVSAIPWVYSLHEDRRNRMWFGAEDGLYLLEYNLHGELKARKLPPELRQVRDIHEDRHGRLWATAQNGLLSLEDDQWRLYTVQDGLSSNFTAAIHEEHDGTLWFTTHGGGLNRFKDGRFFVYTTEHGLHSDGVWRILEDDQGNFWMNSDTGLFRVSKQDLNDIAAGRKERVSSVVFAEAEGMPSAECTPGGWRLQNGQLWISTIEGVAIVEPNHLPVNMEPPEVHIETVVADGVPINRDQASRLPPGTRNLEFRYAALSYLSPEKNQYRYTLEGYDRDWIEAHDRRVAYYTNLDPGRYTFRVLGANNDGVWNEEGASIEVYLTPYFSQTPWFTLLIIGLLVAVLVGAYWLRKQHLLLQFEQDRQRIADDLHDDIGSKIGSLAMFLDYAGKKERLVDEDRRQLQNHASSARQLAQDLRDTVWIVDAGQDHLPALLNRMRQTARQMFAAPGLRFEVPGEVPAIPLDMTWRRCVFLIYKEALHNAVRHAQATRLDVHIALMDETLTITIEDNGTGFDVETARQGRGLQTLHNRAGNVGGSLTIKSRKGEGTTVRLQAKLNG
ncbi:MAG: two-component regulator propeller domain-containing protein [Rhodothermales bacterium]